MCYYICVCYFHISWMWEKISKIMSRKRKMGQSSCSKSKTELPIIFSLQVPNERHFNIFLSIILCVFVLLRNAKFDYQTPSGMFLSACICYPSSKLVSLYIYSATWFFWTHFPAKIIFHKFNFIIQMSWEYLSGEWVRERDATFYFLTCPLFQP